jgi:hypothetical protein
MKIDWVSVHRWLRSSKLISATLILLGGSLAVLGIEYGASINLLLSGTKLLVAIAVLFGLYYLLAIVVLFPLNATVRMIIYCSMIGLFSWAIVFSRGGFS